MYRKEKKKGDMMKAIKSSDTIKQKGKTERDETPLW